MRYYQSNEISNSFKSMIHVILKIQFPDKVWDLIKDFSIMNEEQLNWCRDANKYGAAIRNGIIISFPYYNNIFNKRPMVIGRSIILRRLRLEHNEICNIDALANALKTNNTIKILRLEGNEISDLTSLGEALKVNTTLCELFIWGNQISNIDPVAEALKTNTTLTALNIRSNQISKVDILIEALKINTTLIRIHFIPNPISFNNICSINKLLPELLDFIPSLTRRWHVEGYVFRGLEGSQGTGYYREGTLSSAVEGYYDQI